MKQYRLDFLNQTKYYTDKSKAAKKAAQLINDGIDVKYTEIN